MAYVLLLLAAAAGAGPTGDAPAPQGSYLCQPAYHVDFELRGPTESYCPQPGDLILASDPELWSKLGHLAILSANLQHSAILFARRDGRVGMLQAGPFNSVKIEVLDPLETMGKHVSEGDRVWVRRRRVPLTPEESARLTEFAEMEEGKPFAVWRMLAQMTFFHTRGRYRTYFMGKVQGPNRPSYFCSELVTEAIAYTRLLDADDLRPSATYPRDLFFGSSANPFLDRHLHMESGWLPPSRWLPEPLPPSEAAPSGAAP